MTDSMPETTLLVLTTLPDRATALCIAEILVEEKLAACVNIFDEMTSIYRWHGEIQHGYEHQLVIKTTSDRYDALLARILEQHPYELPEILAMPVSQGLPDYLDWIKKCTTN